MAPLWKRWIAGLVDSTPLFLMALPFLLESRRGSARPPRRELQLAAAALSSAYQIALTTTIGQTLGQMVVGIGVVDAKTAAVPTLRQSALRWTLAAMPEGLSRLLRASVKIEEPTALVDLKAEIERLNERHRGDRQSLNEALRHSTKSAT